ncbi:hypothetical protein Tco_0984351 [Tanacetum coccineum]
MLNRHKNWLVHKQTACGKDFSNPFMVDNLPKIVGFSTHLASLVKSWLVQDQTVLGKDYSNLLIADSLLKTIWFINAPCYGNEALASPKANELTIPEQTATGKGTSNPFMAGGIKGEVGLTSFRNATGANYLAHSRKYVEPPSLKTVREWFPTIRYSRKIKAKGTLKKGFLPSRWRVKKDYTKLIWEDILAKLKKAKREKVLKKNQPKGPSFTAHMLAICNANKLVPFKAPNTSSYNRKKDSTSKNPGAKTRQRKKYTSLTTKINPLSNIKATKGGSSSKKATGSPAGHSEKKKKSSSTKDTNLSQPLASTSMLSSVVSVSKTKPVYSASTIIYSESASGHDALADSTVEDDLGKFALNDSISKQQDKTKPVKDRLETIHTETGTNKEDNKAKREVSFGDDEFNTSLDLSRSDDVTKEIKLEDLSKLVLNVEINFMDLDSSKDDEPITLNSKLVKEKEVAETKAALLKAQPYFLNMEKLIELLVKSLKPELSKLLSSNDFRNSLPTELKELPFKFNEVTGELRDLNKYVHELEIDLLGDLKEIPTKLEKLSSIILISSIQAKIKTLDALISLLNKVTEALDKFAHAIKVASHKAGDHSVPLAGQASTHPAEGEKNTRQATISLFKQRTKKDAKKENLKI